MAGPAMAAPQGGIGDPLTLAASGVLMPFFGDPGDASLLEVASPVGDNSGLHMFFFDASCNRVGDSVFLGLTRDDIAFLQVTGTDGLLDPAPFSFFGSHPKDGGLITIANSIDGFKLDPLTAPIHSRMYLFSTATGKSRIVEPIILDTFEFSGDPHTWSPLRTSVTFFAPRDNFDGINTKLYLICPKTTIQAVNSGGASYFDPALFPAPSPGLMVSSVLQGLRGVVFDTDEHPLVDIHTPCDCVRTTNTISDVSTNGFGQFGISTIYATQNTFTKLETDPVTPSSPFPFTGYRSTSASSVNDFFGRMSNGSTGSIDGRFPTGAASNNR